jgi:hypothetical protein
VRGLTEAEVVILESPRNTYCGDISNAEALIQTGRLKVVDHRVSGGLQVTFAEITAEGREALRIHRIIKALGVST